MSLPRYPAYKDSGADWLGHIPLHWTSAALKRGYEIVSGATPKSEEASFWDGIIDWITPADLSRLDGFNIEGSLRRITEAGLASCGTSLVPAGSIILSTRAPIGSLGMAIAPLCTNQGCKALVPMEFQDPRFAAYVLSVAGPALNVRGKGTTFLELSGDELGRFPFPFPPSEEQQGIARFLDHETAKIDALIAEQEKLLALLAEKRQATISHAVTKGLNPDAPMKDSGIPWLGQVPEHWECAQLGRLCKKVSDGPHFSPSYVDEGVLFISARNIRVDGWSLEDAKYVSEDDYLEFCKRVIPEAGDVLYTKGGTTGIARVVDLEARFQVWVHVAVLKLVDGIALPHFVAYALNSIGCYEQSQLYTRGATNQDLGLTRMVKILLAIPSVEEQAEIVCRLDSETSKLDGLNAEVERTIVLLKERRGALIAAAITGQIDVRGQLKDGRS
jgi:type I restriction enzyme S subunit